MQNKESFESLELKIQEIKIGLERKADAEGTKKGFAFLENKITQVLLWLFSFIFSWLNPILKTPWLWEKASTVSAAQRRWKDWEESLAPNWTGITWLRPTTLRPESVTPNQWENVQLIEKMIFDALFLISNNLTLHILSHYCTIRPFLRRTPFYLWHRK